MKHFISAVAGLAIVVFAYAYTFGIPGVDLSFLNGKGAQTEGPSSSAGPSGPAGPGGPRSRQPTAVIITKAIVRQTPYTEVFQSVGIAKANASVTVETEASGKVTELHFGPNQSVEKGDRLVSLDDQVEQIQLRTARANLLDAKSTLKRYDTLRSSGSGVISEVARTEAQTALEIAEANLARAEYDLEQKTVRAPISGTLGLTDVEVGKFLGMSAEVVTITDQSTLLIEFGLPDRAAGLLRVGQDVVLTSVSLPGRTFSGVVKGYDGRIDSATRTLKVRAEVENSAGLMLPGMIFNVTVTHDNEALPMVPANSVTWTREGAKVWVVEKGRANTTNVAIRHRENDLVWLDSELTDGMEVVVEGVQKLRAGSEVMTAAEASARSRAAVERGGKN